MASLDELIANLSTDPDPSLLVQPSGRETLFDKALRMEPEEFSKVFDKAVNGHRHFHFTRADSSHTAAAPALKK